MKIYVFNKYDVALVKENFFIIFSDINVPLILALVYELMVSTQLMSWKFAKILHFINLGSCLMVPVIVINSKFEHVGPGIIFL